MGYGLELPSGFRDTHLGRLQFALSVFVGENQTLLTW
jgi:hypothetical protein